MNQNKLVLLGFSFAAFTIAWSVASLIIYFPSAEGQEPSLILNSDSVKVKLLSEKKPIKKTILITSIFLGQGDQIHEPLEELRILTVQK